MRNSTAEKIRKIIEDFWAVQPFTYLAHVVLEDFNLTDHDISYAIEYEIPHNFQMCEGEGVTQEDVDQIIAFLRFLLTFSEDDRSAVEQE